MAAPNLFSLFEGYRAQADLERADQQRAEQARSAQLNFDVATRVEEEAQDGAQARANARQLDLNLTRFQLEDQPDALQDKQATVDFERAGRKAKIATEAPLLGRMASIVAETQMERAVLGLQQVQFSNDQEDVRQNIAATLGASQLDALQRQQVADRAATALSNDPAYQEVLAVGRRAAGLIPVLANAAQINDMVGMNKVGQQLGLEFRLIPGVDGGAATIAFSQAGADTWSPWLGQESIPGWAATQNRKATLEQREAAKAEAALVYQDRLAAAQREHALEQGKLAAKLAEIAAKRKEDSPGPAPSLLGGVPTSPTAAPAAVQAAPAAPAPTIGQVPAAAGKPKPIPTALQQRAEPAPAAGLRPRSAAYEAAVAKKAADDQAQRTAFQAQAKAAAEAAASRIAEREAARQRDLAAMRSTK